MIDTAINLLSPSPEDIVYDIGAGDGNFIIRCAESTNASKVFGIEICDERVSNAIASINEKGLQDKCEMILGNALECDISEATCVFLYLIPRGLKIILPILQKINHKLRVVTYMSPFVDIVPIKVINVTTDKHEGSGWPLYYYELNY